MGATTTSNKTLHNILSSKDFVEILKQDYPDFIFKGGVQEHWSSKTQTITYIPAKPCYGLLHELAHAVLGHKNYKSDFELLKLESDAWELASKIGKTYGIKIDEDHIQNCLDTYRDWLHKRSTCPSCGTHVLQNDLNSYQCFNCQATWKVSSAKFVRPYRKTIK